MKNFVLIAGLALAFSAFAFADSAPVVVANKVGVTSTSTSEKMNGFLEAFVINVTGATTQTITVVSSRTGETILTKTTSADVVCRPTVSLQTSVGANLVGISNQVSKFYMSNDALVFSVTETAPVTNSTTIVIQASK